MPTSCLMFLPKNILENITNPASLCVSLCSGSAALTALRAANIGAIDVVIVSGVAGSISHLAEHIARSVIRAKVISINAVYERHADVLLNVPQTSNPQGSDWADFLTSVRIACSQLRRDQTMHRAADAVIICTNAPSAFDNLEDCVCDRGTIVYVRVPRGLVLKLFIHALVERNLHLIGSLMGDHSVALEAMRLIENGTIEPLINKVRLEDIAMQMQNLANGKAGIGKIVARIVWVRVKSSGPNYTTGNLGIMALRCSPKEGGPK
ncbi:hypothetical protein BKA67DRAFT_648140 [Truncatella angustata]|uniref:Uncharacterized protein n=1 Tax=Truncatella angustata TaxID=152316 RepID=A0A9P8UHG4_9PEZI|nr:uncharacterized protein BKA67DRAFT_648140 [Truncatella angustata]KAH6652256.1 hypothetical protein BKA67DRAFT_648140 [Truncatella angustata]